MFGFGGLSELFFIAFLAMLIFGPEKLPEMGRMLAKVLAEVRKASNELKRTLNTELAAAELEQNARRAQQSLPPAAAGPGPLLAPAPSTVSPSSAGQPHVAPREAPPATVAAAGWGAASVASVASVAPMVAAVAPPAAAEPAPAPAPPPAPAAAAAPTHGAPGGTEAEAPPPAAPAHAAPLAPAAEGAAAAQDREGADELRAG